MTAEAPSSPASAVVLSTTVPARVLRHDPKYGMSTLFFADGELRVPMVDAAIDAGVSVIIEARDVSITNRLPGRIEAILPLDPPYVRVTFDLGATKLHALVTLESVERLALEPDLSAWAMIKSVAIGPGAVRPSELPRPRRWPASDNEGP
ncbi:TOBE domain-containing protein [Bradyrhizobium sp.]|uniref:TOBE domain-containing protein n=1 Tax=Bradyrhizobium sp. TaxID=376 RepID=UPI0029133CC9|nr:TOBE domain-containing protein [Bradyrhizobium sp.]MDU6490131.1 TOBE domain-containing protein [Bradyrhizobium sp.]